jgi:hypothetical protein
MWKNMYGTNWLIGQTRKIDPKINEFVTESK